jgi:hypothetical protein
MVRIFKGGGRSKNLSPENRQTPASFSPDAGFVFFMITDSAIKKLALHHKRYGKLEPIIRLYAEALSEQGNNNVKAFMDRAINHHTTSGDIKDLKRASTSWFNRSLE